MLNTSLRHQVLSVPSPLPPAAAEFAVLCAAIAVADPYITPAFDAAGFLSGWMPLVGIVVVMLAGLWRVQRTQRTPTAAIVGVAAILAYLFAADFGWPTALVVVLAAFGEEAAYRVAMPNVVASLLRRRGVHWWKGWWIGGLTSSVVFVFQPGHMNQFNSPLKPLVFAAFGVGFCAIYAVTQNLVLTSALHAGVNLVSYPLLLGEGSNLARIAWILALMACVTWAVLTTNLTQGVPPPDDVVERHNRRLRKQGVIPPPVPGLP